jgi:hypothetical protein
VPRRRARALPRRGATAAAAAARIARHGGAGAVAAIGRSGGLGVDSPWFARIVFPRLFIFPCYYCVEIYHFFHVLVL